MKYKDFSESINWSNHTAFVCDSPNNRYTYSSGEPTDDTFANVTADTEFTFALIDEFPEVKKVIEENFLAELKPAKGVEDDGYNAVKKAIENGEAFLAYWQEEIHYGPDIIPTTVYMLVLDDVEAIEDTKTYDVVFDSDTEKGYVCKL